MELKEKPTLSREEAAARLHAIADELASKNDVVIEREDLKFVADVPDQVHLNVEFEIEDDGTELEIELTWWSVIAPWTGSLQTVIGSHHMLNKGVPRIGSGYNEDHSVYLPDHAGRD
jgi:amphi-Trp domain-containing protein